MPGLPGKSRTVIAPYEGKENKKAISHSSAMIKRVSDFDGRVTNGNTTARKRSHAMATNVFVVTKLNTTTLGFSNLHIASPISQFPIKSSGNKNGRQSTDPMSEMAKFITKQYVLVWRRRVRLEIIHTATLPTKAKTMITAYITKRNILRAIGSK